MDFCTKGILPEGSQLGWVSVAQQSLEGSRIPVDQSGRSLSYFDWKDESLASRGFIKHSYANGLDPHEYFFHSIAGREGLVDTAVKTSITGYIKRRAIKGMEDNRIVYDGTVRNAEQCIISLIPCTDSTACKL